MLPEQTPEPQELFATSQLKSVVLGNLSPVLAVDHDGVRSLCREQAQHGECHQSKTHGRSLLLEVLPGDAGNAVRTGSPERDRATGGLQ